MHEASLMQSAIEHALDAADRAGASRIFGVRLRIGAWSGVVPDALQLAFEVVTRDTAADGAHLIVDTVEAICHCDDCAREFSPPVQILTCPACGGGSTRILAGQELELAGIEVSDP